MNRKSQEEIVGFILVVVVVAVIFLIFLGISMRKPPTTTDRTEVDEVSQFLNAMLEFTTNCTVSSTPLNFKDLIIHSNEGRPCDDPSINTNHLLATLSKGIIEASWPIGEERPFKGYSFYAKQETDAGESLIFNVSEIKGASSVQAREWKIAEKPIGKGITVTFKLAERLD